MGEGYGASAVAKKLCIGRASVYRRTPPHHKAAGPLGRLVWFAGNGAIGVLDQQGGPAEQDDEKDERCPIRRLSCCRFHGHLV
jgi:hypothetical protein